MWSVMGWWSGRAHRDGKLLEGSEQAVLQSQSRQGQGRQQGWPGPSVFWEAVMETFIRVEAVSECWTPYRLCPEGLDAEHEEKRAPHPKEFAQFVQRDGAGVLREALEFSLGHKSKTTTAYPSATDSGTMSKIGFREKFNV